MAAKPKTAYQKLSLKIAIALSQLMDDDDDFVDADILTLALDAGYRVELPTGETFLIALTPAPDGIVAVTKEEYNALQAFKASEQKG